MTRGMFLATATLVLACGLSVPNEGRCDIGRAALDSPPDTVESHVPPGAVASGAPSDTAWSHGTSDSTGGGYTRADTTRAAGIESWGLTRPRFPPGVKAERASYKSLWELLAGVPELRWTGSGGLGGVEALSIRGRAMRRARVIADGVPLGVDLNLFAPSLVDSVRVLSGTSTLGDVLSDGAEGVEVFSETRASEAQEGFLSLGKGDFQSGFNAFSFSRRRESYRFSLRFAGASFGAAASYASYSRDGVALGGAYRFDSGHELGVQARRFKSSSVRYTADKTQSKLNSVMLSAAESRRGGFSWRARAFFLDSKYSYSENGPDVEDAISTAGAAVDLQPGGESGRQHVSLALRRDALGRNVGPSALPEEPYGPPYEGRRSSLDASAVYSLRFMGEGRSGTTAVLRLDRKELFGWALSFVVSAARDLDALGRVEVQGGRTAYMPDYQEIYAPRDETARPSWFAAARGEPESEWSASAQWALNSGAWSAFAGGFGAKRNHVLAPPDEWLGLNGGSVPAATAPIEDLGRGSSAGAWGGLRVRPFDWIEVGAWYSAQRSRAAGDRLPFEPSQVAGLWIRGERRYFGGDMSVGVLLRGILYSSQATPLETELPSYGLAEAMGYVTVSDVVFFYELKNLETRPRPSTILDRADNRYLLEPGPEVRLGLVWYLPG